MSTFNVPHHKRPLKSLMQFCNLLIRMAIAFEANNAAIFLICQAVSSKFERISIKFEGVCSQHRYDKLFEECFRRALNAIQRSSLQRTCQASETQ